MVGGDKLTYDADTGSPAANLLETKLLFNSVISDAKKGARFASMDLMDMFLRTKMKDPEYMKVPLKYFPLEIRQKYGLEQLQQNNFFRLTNTQQGTHPNHIRNYTHR